MTLSISTPPVTKGNAGRFEWLWWVILFALVTLTWCAAYNRWTLEAWRTPVAYGGDALVVMANAKAFASGEVYPAVLKYPASLGAPFTANWNDYPSPSEGLFSWAGLLARIFGVFTGANITVLCAHLLAAGSFYFACRILGYRRVFSLCGAIIFSMSRHAFARNLAHLGPAYYWHVPLALLVIWWAVGNDSILRNPRRVWFCIIVAVLHGIQDTYFAGMFLQFLVLASLVCLIRRKTWSRILFPLGIASVVLATCVVMNLDTFYNRLANGPNPESMVRDYAALETYALKPLELFLPIDHRLPALQLWTHKVYETQAIVRGEMGSAYLGIIGIIGFAFLIWSTARAAALSRAGSVPSHFWLILWVVFYSIVGGINGFLGLFGIIVFRSSNRYSIVILAIVLLFLVKRLSALTNKSRHVLVAVAAGVVTCIAVLDQSPRPPTRAAIKRARELVASDKQIVTALEAKLPAQAMIFELPVVGFPEMSPIRGMQDYEHFRPYLHSRSLRFSYGSVKGRTRERWQAETARLGAAYLVNALERYGFSAILINKKAYEANGAALLAELSAAGRSEILCESGDLVCVRLRPASHPILPPEFDHNWSLLEGDATATLRWSHGNASIIFHNEGGAARQVHLSFSLGTLRPREIEISDGTRQLYQSSLAENQPPSPVSLTIFLPPGRSELRFRTNVPAELPGTGDQRKLAFNVRNFTIEE